MADLATVNSSLSSAVPSNEEESTYVVRSPEKRSVEDSVYTVPTPYARLAATEIPSSEKIFDVGDEVVSTLDDGQEMSPQERLAIEYYNQNVNKSERFTGRFVSNTALQDEEMRDSIIQETATMFVNGANDPLLDTKVQVLANNPSLIVTDPEAVTRAASSLAVYQEIGKIWEEQDFLDVVGKAGSLLVTPDFRTGAYRDVAEQEGIEWEGSWDWNPKPFFDRLKQRYADDPQAMGEFAGRMAETVGETWLSNDIHAMMFLQYLTEETSTSGHGFESGLEKFDWALTVGAPLYVVGERAGAALGLLGTTKRLNALRRSAELGEVDKLASAVRAGLDNSLAPANIDSVDAATTLLPNPTLEHLAPGAATSSARAVMKEHNVIDAYLDTIDELNVNYDFLSDAEKVSFRQRIEAFYDKKMEDNIVNSFETEFFDEGLRVHYVDTDGVSRTEEVPFNLLDQGGFSGENTRFVSAGASPNFFFKDADRKLLVHERERLQGIEGVITEAYSEALREASRPLSWKPFGMKNVEAVLEAGDSWTDANGIRVGREFTFHELTSTNIAGKQLSKKEAKVYMEIRRVVEHMRKTKSRQMARDQIALGRRMMDFEGEKVLVQPYESVHAARSGLSSDTVLDSSVYIDANGGLLANGKKLKLEDWYNKGYVLYRTRGPEYVNAKGVNYQFVLRRPETTVDIPPDGLLNRRPGYMPKIHYNRNFFVKEYKDVKLGGSGTVYREGKVSTQFSFSTQNRGLSYLDDLEKSGNWRREGNALISLDPENPVTIRLEPARETGLADNDIFNDMGGLITGKRSDKMIRHDPSYGKEELSEEARRMKVLSSLSRYIHHLSHEVPMSVYRASLRDRFMKQAEALIGKEKVLKSSFEEVLGSLEPTTRQHSTLIKMGNQIKSLDFFKTEGEKMIDGIFHNVGEALDGAKFPGAHLLYRFDTKWILSMMRAMSFRLMLGLLTPVQLVIQSSALTIPLSINPFLTSKAIAKIAAFEVLDNLVSLYTRNGRGYNKAYEAASRALGSRLGIDMSDHMLWRRSGVGQNIKRKNPDYDSFFEETPFKQGVHRRLASATDYFYTAGETARARTAFQAAVEWTRKQLGRNPTEKDMPMIMKRYEDYSLHMSHANKASWQHGMTSIPTQFMQVQTKTLETLVGGQAFTATERAKLLVGQAVIFGSAGIPLLGSLAPMVYKNWLNHETATPEQLRVARDGAIGYILREGMGIDAAIVPRVQIGGQMFEAIADFMLDDAPFKMEMIFGPSGAWMEQSGVVLDDFMFVSRNIMLFEEASEGDNEMLLAYLGRSILQLPSSTRSAIAARMLGKSKYFRNRSGVPVFELADVNEQTRWARALGFQLNEVKDWYDINPNDPSNSGSTAGTEADLIIKFLGTMFDEYETDPDKARVAALAYNVMMSSYEGDPELREEIRQTIERRLEAPSHAWHDRLNEALQALASRLETGQSQTLREARITTNPGFAERVQKPQEEIGDR